MGYCSCRLSGAVGLLCLAAVLSATAAQLPYYGVNLAGAEFNEYNLPGTSGTDYKYPTNEEIDYFVGTKGMNTIRLPFRWERLQRTINGSFNSMEQDRLTTVVSYITNKGAVCILDPHNYARYKTSQGDKLIGTDITMYEFGDLWSKLSELFKSNSLVWFGLVNEPNSMATEKWREAAQHAINVIRSTGATNKILVPGNAWTGAHSWAQNWYGTPNADEMVKITDSGNNMAFEVHQYFDGDFSGQGSGCQSATIGAEKLAGFTTWLRDNGRKGFLGEFAGGDSTTCRDAVTGALNHMQSNSDVWIGWTWWAAGPLWGSYMFTIEPTNSFTTDAPQMAWLTPFMGPAAPEAPMPPSTGPAPQSTGGAPQTQALGTQLPYFGVNLAGAEFGEGNIPGTYDTDYTYPTTAEVDYFVTTKGMTVIRLPFRWERLQRSINATFDSTEQGRLTNLVSYITNTKQAVCLIDPHNYARYKQNGAEYIVGSAEVTNYDFANFWTKLSTLFKNNPRVWFGLVNEPYSMPTAQWRAAAQEAINAIRATGAINKILVPGNYYTGAHSWMSDAYGGANGVEMLKITDPGNNMAFEVHQYLNSDYSGGSGECQWGSEKLTEFTNWLKVNGKKGFLGEIGGGNNPICQDKVTGVFNYMQQNADVWLGWTWWAAGPWWPSNYVHLLEPTNNFATDAPQMAWLVPFMNKDAIAADQPQIAQVPVGAAAAVSATFVQLIFAFAGIFLGIMLI